MISWPKSMPGSLEDLEQHVAREHVDAHRRDERLLGRDAAGGRSARDAAADLREPRRVGFSSKPTICPSSSNRKMPICVASAASTGCAAMVMSARALDVRLDQLAEVHPVEVVAGEDQVVVGVVAA